jgi:hypothetical protein
LDRASAPGSRLERPIDVPTSQLEGQLEWNAASSSRFWAVRRRVAADCACAAGRAHAAHRRADNHAGRTGLAGAKSRRWHEVIE